MKRRRSKQNAVFSLFLLAILSSFLIPPQHAIASPLYYYTSDGKIYDYYDNEVTLSGFNTYLGLENTYDKFENMAEDGATTVRIMLIRQDIMNSGINPNWNLDALDEAVGWCGQVGIKVILDLQMWTDDIDNAPGTLLSSGTIQAEWQNFWILLVDHYNQNVTVIGVDILNEPYNIGVVNDIPIPGSVTDPQGTYETLAHNLIVLLKSHNSQLLYILEAYDTNAEGGPEWNDTSLLYMANMILSDHIYYHLSTWRTWYDDYDSGDPATGQAEMETWIQDNWGNWTTEGVPFWCGEVGAIDTDNNWDVQFEDELTILDDAGIGYSCYTYQAYAWTEPFDVIDREDPEAYVLTNVGELFVTFLVILPISFSDDFEDDLNQWSILAEANSSISVDSFQPHSGIGCAKFYSQGNGSDTEAQARITNSTVFGISGSHVYVSCWIKFSQLENVPDDPYGMEILVVKTYPDESYLGRIHIANNSGTIYWLLRTTTYGYNMTAVEVGMNVWVHIEIESFIDGTNGFTALTIDNVLALNMTGLDLGDDSAIGTIRLRMVNYDMTGGTENIMYVDDFQLFEELDTAPPTYEDLTYSSTIAGSLAKFSVTADDDVSLDYAVLATNKTGIWTDSASISISTTPAVVNSSIVLPSQSGTLAYEWTIFDTAGNQNATGIQYLAIASAPGENPPPPNNPDPGTPAGMVTDTTPMLMLIFLTGTALVLVTSKRSIYENEKDKVWKTWR